MGFTPGSREALKALQVEHRYESHLPTLSPQRAATFYCPSGRRVLSHQFEAQKAHENAVNIDRQLHPSGQRFAAALAWLEQRHLDRCRQEQQEETLGQARWAHQREHQTSSDNPLCAHMQTAVAAVAAAAGGAADTEHNPPVAAADAAVDAAVDAAADAAADEIFGSSSLWRPGSASRKLCSPECVAARRQNLGQLEIGSLSPQLLTEPVIGEDVRSKAAQEALLKQQEMDQLLAFLLQQYPHGIPKRMLTDLRSLGVAAPPLGFGVPQSSPPLDALLLGKK